MSDNLHALGLFNKISRQCGNKTVGERKTRNSNSRFGHAHHDIIKVRTMSSELCCKFSSKHWDDFLEIYLKSLSGKVP